MLGNANSCFQCERNGATDKLDKHHIFGGANRKLSEEDGLYCMLCHHDHHIFGPDAVHQNHDVDLWLKQVGQRYAMIKHGWTVEQFRERYGKNYLDEEYDESGLDIEFEEDEVC